MPFAAPRDAAVIDIGSNSVRLVVYRLEGRAIWTVFNEKVLAGLGRDLGDGGRLNPEGVAQTLAALKRFRAVLEAVKPAETFIAATAAVREAKDGAAFVEQIKAETGFATRVLSGEEEARYAALGVLAGAPDATGVVGDLGGASLELVRLETTGAGLGVTLPLGPFSLGLSEGFDLEKVRRLCAQRLAPAAQAFRTDVFHAVGGAWRNLALLHMRLAGYPLHVVHQYSIGRAEALDAARLVAHQSKSSLDRIEGMSKKRSETLPYAAVVLEQLIESLDLKRIEISAYGVREGLLFEAMPPGVRRLDPLVEGCASLGARQGVADELGAALDAWLAPALAQLPPCFDQRDPVLASAACRLADLGARLHPDHRADLVFEQVLRAPIAGQTHAERAFLAAATFARHATAFTPPELDVLERLLSPGRLKRARAVGAAIRLGCDLSGRSAPLLARSRLAIDKGDLLLAAEPGYADLLLGEQTAKRAGALATILGLKLKITAL
ncbi:MULTISPECIES: Ppx/GppA phosphatase family protein [Caulobacter]|uniref:Exopolyphosphatase/guanosine-5'-triphosphate, 3'-diphosphate pyrophosphatase n=1 Tax=Caulobacter rhizosphaerae TaxID=2010972 RepID=A0ABU1N5G3_9CAUL|nr:MULTISPECIES: Ppx/GppA phosphatase family protein [Caulobacter]KQZ33915.1 exopolyphosphatase [Caulobacter sp. Root1472]MDR6533682.1 exopolyphosphatase/guanosine-5'-triphosphate,3'-diphosphate pyrophosphatase [Caulobacter rhizosphaerae]